MNVKILTFIKKYIIVFFEYYKYDNLIIHINILKFNFKDIFFLYF